MTNGVPSLLIAIGVSIASLSAFGQTATEKKIAADRWLAKTSFKVHYVGSYTSDFDVNTVDKTIVLAGNPNGNRCQGSVPAALTFEGDELVLTITPRLKNCDQIQYLFDPVTGDGHARHRDQFAGPNGSWTDTQSKVTLLDPAPKN